MGGKAQRVGTMFYWGRWPLKTPGKDFHFAVGGRLGWMKWLKIGQKKNYIPCNFFSCIISFLENILLAKLSYWFFVYIQYAWISILKKQNSNQNMKLETYSQEIKESRNMSSKTPTSFNLSKYVEKHCNGPYWVHNKTQKQAELQ